MFASFESPSLIDISPCLPIQGWMNEDELTWLATTASKSRNIVEVGAWRGRSTMALIQYAAGRMWTVDAWCACEDPDDPVSRHVRDDGGEAIYLEFVVRFLPFLNSGKLNLLREKSTEAAQFLKNVHGKIFDFVFIDGDHSYKWMRDDLDAYLPLVVEGGIISGHDIWMEGVAKAVKEVFSGYSRPAGNIWSVVV